MKAEIYQTHPKHVLEPNGLFDDQKAKDIECYCKHKQNSHLDGDGICLTGLCICERFNTDGKALSPKAIARKNLPSRF